MTEEEKICRWSESNALKLALLEQKVDNLAKTIGDESSGLVKNVNSLQTLITRALGGVAAIVILAAIMNFIASLASSFRK